MGQDSDYYAGRDADAPDQRNMRPDMAYADVEPQGLQLLGTSQQLAALFGALATAQGAFKPVHKNREVTIRTDKGPYTFSYAELSQSLDATRDALAANGLAVSQPFALSDGYATVRTILSHKEGGLMISTCHLQKASAMKDLGGLLTYCRRYAFNALLSLAADEDLDDQPEASRGETGAQSGPRTPKQEEPRRAPSTPQTQAAPKASTPAQSASTAGSTPAQSASTAGSTRGASSQPTQSSKSSDASTSTPKSNASSASAPAAGAGESPKGQTAPSSGPASSTTSSQPQTSSKPANDSSGSAPSQASIPAGNTPLTETQRASIYAVLGKLGIPAPRAAAHLTAVMNRLGLPPGKVTGETYQRVVDALNAELPAGGANG